MGWWRSAAVKRGRKASVRSKFASGELRSYFAEARGALDLNNARPIVGIEAMNAMLIKIHSLLSDDGLPIYDSRVAACAGALVELYYRANDIHESRADLPQFPSTDDNRRISRLLNDCRVTDVIRYNSKNCSTKWASSAVALGRVLRAVLALRPGLFSNIDGLRNRMHALEAAMFMIGADLGKPPASAFHHPQRETGEIECRPRASDRST